MAELNICTINVNGLRAQAKKKQLKQFINDNKIDIVFIQEAHYMSSSDKTWENEWDGLSIWAGSSNYSAGVGIIFNKNQEISIKKDVKDPEGRYIIANCTVETKEYTLVCVYWSDNPTESLKTLILC